MSNSQISDIPAVRDYLNRIGAEPRSLRGAVVRENVGKYWRDLATIRFAKDGTIDVADPAFAPTEAEKNAIAVAFAGITWPEIKPIRQLGAVPWTARPEDTFEFRNAEGDIVMVQVRLATKDGSGKIYLPWTFWTDGQWRQVEPEGPLPLFGADRLAGAATVFIHEGAKAARHCQWMADGASPAARAAAAAHPWGEELGGAVHLGWIGGALSPQRTDWSALQKAGIRRAYIVADNDLPGLSAVPKIARQIKCITFAIRFTDDFPPSFDLADPFPEQMFRGSRKFYVGPTFRQCLDPATWATDLVPQPKGRPIARLRESFKEMWAYSESADLYVCKEMPTRRRSDQMINKTLAPFSDIDNVGRLIQRAYEGRTVGLCYRPDSEGLMVTYQDSQSINLHVGADVVPQFGDVGPWEEFCEYLFVNADERHQVKRWVATLIARPDRRMGYGLLLISEHQGVGKTTLGSRVLAPLVGTWNVGYPSEVDILGTFNGWLAHKRLVLIGEIYSGSSWRAYNALKSAITDHELMVNEKYQQPYMIENWAHIVACSNSMRALKMEQDDRRWLYPEITEQAWSPDKFEDFRAWLDGGGLQLIKGWAETWEDYVGPAERAPMTARKKEMIEGSRSEAQREAGALAEALNDWDRPASLALKDVVGWCQSMAQGKVHDSDYEIRRAMQEKGLRVFPERVKVASRLEYILMNKAMVRSLREKDEGEEILRKAERNAFVRESIVKAMQVMEPQM